MYLYMCIKRDRMAQKKKVKERWLRGRRGKEKWELEKEESKNSVKKGWRKNGKKNRSLTDFLMERERRPRRS